MARIKLIIIQLVLFCVVPFSFSQESQKSTNTYDVAVDTALEIVDLGENKLAVTRATDTEVPERIMKKMREMEEIAAGIKGQDDVALEKIGGEVDSAIVSLPLNSDLITAIKDKRFDWRVRYLLMLYKSYTAGDSKISKYSDEFISIMRDKTEHNRVRGMAALMLVDISAKNAKVNLA
ncbi:MAG: hypothetical protein Q7J73_05935, partial [Dehalococcoidales bacterium]|nr:hypothetical protein [Dehalococcoidales bacterium]